MKKKLIIILISILIYGCNNADINDKDKRNEDWIYWIDAKTGEASWVPVGDETTIKDGRYTSFYTKGMIFQKGKLKNGKHIDTIYDYDINGKIMQYELVKPDTTINYYLQDGPFISYLQNGKLFEKGFIKNHKEGEEWTKYHENGNIKYEEKLKDGNGFSRWYYENGQISDSVYYIKNKMHGEIKHWHKNGQIREICGWKNGIQNGIYETYYENGKPKEKATLINDELDGKNERWHKNGQKDFIHFYKLGVREGNVKEWYSNGKMEIDANYSSGKKNGKVTLYYENGNLRTEQFFKNDQRNGVCIWYDENGKLIQKEIYVDGQIVTK
ncbi:toxin-antitoxin system YwqK family antitoxin [Flavobacterium psychrophilum]|uniref:toxin-antitoxin system YwqK family antitoxin n=1 Tax=Flavobacterium psychrophilum TaxID=96345 RepID=UPI000B7C1253|nr:toxin-antitoxin system YwqK family antitoxin [Flavobacterium psychrophilum]MCB6230313.1 toxin-antitoxin system YwqK family antitoxin [Flavobacterium psychrophilum]SNA85100.1 exported hypothetical protein [Flavobacterium psychrophilum]SNA88146.1 exported hypothetical protein [Flavobacterium psychrophilum]